MSKTILVADDEPNIVISLEYLLQREGYVVIVAKDGQEALDVIARDKLPDRPQFVERRRIAGHGQQNHPP